MNLRWTAWFPTKRVADNAIKQHKYIIQDAFDFSSWIEST